MKLLHITDIHNDLEALTKVRDFAAKRDDLEVLVCSGDIIGQCLSDEKTKQMHYALAFIRNNVQTNGQVPFEEILRFIRFSPNPNISENIRRAAEDYLAAEKEFDENAERQYKAFLEIFKQFPQTVLIVPGNWDSKQFFDYFGEFNLHKNARQIGDFKFAGYGQAPEGVICIPPTRTIGFSEEEIYEFLTKTDPDIAVTHVTPYGILNRVKEDNIRESFATLAYISRERPMLLLCGHDHLSRGAKRDGGKTSTIILNSGNLGKYRTLPIQGTFTEIEIDDEVVSLVPYRIEDGEVKKYDKIEVNENNTNNSPVQLASEE